MVMADVDYTRSLCTIKASVRQTSYPPSRYTALPPSALNPARSPGSNNRLLTGKSELKMHLMRRGNEL